MDKIDKMARIVCYVILYEHTFYTCLRTSKWKNKDGKGGEGSIRHDGTEFWDGFKKEWLVCYNEECKVWVSLRVPDVSKMDEGMF